MRGKDGFFGQYTNKFGFNPDLQQEIASGYQPKQFQVTKIEAERRMTPTKNRDSF